VRKQTSVQGVVLAGVHAWGNCFLEYAMPRPLVPMVDRPLIAHPLSWLREGGITSASICANSETAYLRRHLGNGHRWGISLDYYEDVMPRGPAGCTRDAVIQNGCTTFVVVEATTVPQILLTDLLEAHRSSGAALTIVVTGADTGSSHPDGMLEPTGIYVFSQSALEHVPTTGYQDIKEALIPRLHAKGLRVMTYAVNANVAPRITGAASYLAVSKWIVERAAGEKACPQGYVRCGEARLHESARVHASVRWVGPVLIEPGCVIEADALIVGPTTVGQGCMIGERAVVSRSALWLDCHVAEEAIVDHCVLTSHSRIKAQQRLSHMVCLPRHNHRRSWLSRLIEGWSGNGEQREVKGSDPASRDACPPMTAPAEEEHWIPARCASPPDRTPLSSIGG